MPLPPPPLPYPGTDEPRPAGFDPLGLRHDDAPPAPPPDTALTMPRVRLKANPDGSAPAIGHHEAELWTELQAAAQLARSGQARYALDAFEAVIQRVAEIGEPGLAVIAAKAAYNRAVVFEKLLADLTTAEAEMERLHGAFGEHDQVEARTVAGRAGLHAARLAAATGRMTLAMNRYRERLANFRDVLPPTELQAFNLDFLRQRATARQRGLEMTARLTTLPSGASPTPGVPDMPGVNDPHDQRWAGLTARLAAVEARNATEVDHVRQELRAELDAMRTTVATLEERLHDARLSMQTRHDRLAQELRDRTEELRADSRRRLRLLRSEVQRLGSEQRSARNAIVGVVVVAAIAIGVAMYLFNSVLVGALARMPH